ncbi:dehypoxanthine futalosine cyclase [Thermogymnomonas acidicola]|uniref:Cyclic dehypoxanthine futalosine synthase n=1 Tax=Thermogymnomonas acidicola TaxID=399579 RepID=A0AA37BQC9_9ARCH|nr:cyclic dehypoxanthinyl futalosine synthase [Thermogymnomonas acidicola]GGM67289.1 dehypoxanthine futalosine cyclase [Thermogymnomonas acidicola]
MEDLAWLSESVRSGDTLTEDDIIYMYEEADLHSLGALARELADRATGNRISFVSNMILNYTNVCNVRCHFCAFYRTGTESDAYTMTREQVLERISLFYDRYGIRQLLIQGGVNPSLGIEYYEDLFRAIRERFPELGIHGLSTSEISFISRKEKMSVREVISRLREAGLETIPGAGAEIFDPEVRKKIGRPPMSGKEWLSVMETAHSMGIKTSATMMFGHLETSRDRARHLLSILELQKKYHGFLSFTPWNFEPGGTRLQKEGKVTYRAGGQEVLRNIAISRIVFSGHLDTIQSSWLTNGVQMGQMAILYGANDWGGTIYDERVIPATGKQVGNLRKETIISGIKQIGMVPVERNNRYEVIREYT